MIDQICQALIDAHIPARNVEQLRRRLFQRRSGCIQYYGAHAENGDPIFSITVARQTSSWKLHRLIYAAMKGPLKGRTEMLLPTCHFKGCCNPEHRKLIQRHEFMRLTSESSKRRSKKLDWSMVHRVRSTPQVTCATFAREYGVSHNTIWRIRNNLTWRDA